MKIGKVSLGSGSNSVVIENIELDSLSDITNIVTLIAEQAKFASDICYHQKICEDYPQKCSTCDRRPRKSYYYRVEKAKQ